MSQLREDFARWRDDPVTQMVFRAMGFAADAQKERWDAAAWGGGMARAEDLKDMLHELRVRADCYRALQELTFDDLARWLGIEDAE